MSLFDKLLKAIVPLPQIKKSHKFLFIGPHPDDIEIGAGETASLLTNRGDEVKFLICTDGRHGIYDEKLCVEDKVEIRKNESVNSAKILGVNEVEFLSFPDGGSYTAEELAREISKVVAEYNPDFIFAPDPTVKTELHTDHIKCGLAAGYAFLRSEVKSQLAEDGLVALPVKGIAYYFTDKPNQYIKTKGRKVFDKKIESILAHKSQFPNSTETEKADFNGIKAYFTFRSIRFGLRTCFGRADGFRVQGRVHSHCAPESVNI